MKPTTSLLALLLSAPLFAAPPQGAVAKEELKTAPYYQDGGYVGNGADGLDLVPEKDLRDEDAVVPPPKAIANSGYIRIDGKPNEDYGTGTFEWFKLRKCKGSADKSGNFSALYGGCAVGQEMSVALNARTQIAPGYYTLSTTGTTSGDIAAEGKITYDSGSEIVFPGIIKIEKGRTTVIPLPKIVLPQIADETYIVASADYENAGMRRALAYQTWNHAYPIECEGARAEERREACAYAAKTHWTQSLRFWKFELNGDKTFPELTAIAATLSREKAGFLPGRWGNIAPQINGPVLSGKHITIFPGVYRLKYDSIRGYKDAQKGIRVGAFTEDMVGKVFPQEAPAKPATPKEKGK